MSKIYEMSPHLADLISAGEVVERPCSVAKELVENSIDAGAKKITVEIKNGGMSFIRVTDDGTGISRDDVPLAFHRHATSKLRNESGLESIKTLGFRGEALAAIAAVSRVEVTTRTEEEIEGTRMILEAGEVKLTEAFGCPQGTTMTVSDLFYNTPSRRKFLKNDRAEATAVSSIMTQMSLSHPELSIKYIRDNREEYMTPGDGRVDSCVYCILGRDVAKGLLPIEGENEGINVSGYVSTPATARGNRAMQFFFLNGRSIKSRVLQAALEQAYKNTLLTGRFPVCILDIKLPLSQVDVNVHPSKTEVRFSDEHTIAATIFWFTKKALESENPTMDTQFPRSDLSKNMAGYTESPSAPQTGLPNSAPVTAVGSGISGTAAAAVGGSGTLSGKVTSPRGDFFKTIPSDKFRSKFVSKTTGQDQISLVNTMYEPLKTANNCTVDPPEAPAANNAPPVNAVYEPFEPENNRGADPPEAPVQETESADETVPEPAPEPEYIDEPWRTIPNMPPCVRYRYVGELMNTYIIAEMETMVLLVDKHAVHERLIFNKLREQGSCKDAQILITPIICKVSDDTIESLQHDRPLLMEFGYDIDDVGNGNVAIRQVPIDMDLSDPTALVEQLVQKLRYPNGARAGLMSINDDLFHMTACRAAIKAGKRSDPVEARRLIELVIAGKLSYCPHGRPTVVRIMKEDINDRFERR